MKLNSIRPRQSSATLTAVAFSATIFVATLTIACATATPLELQHARVAYSRASAGPAAQMTPSDLHKAKTALDRAEQSFADDRDSQATIDFAYVAERTAQIAEAHAETALAEKRISKAKQELGERQGEIAKATQGALANTREQLGQAERGKAQQTQEANAERTAREQADQKADASERKAAASEEKAQEANAALARLAAKEEERGMVITLSGSVLFRSNDTTLLPAAQTRLDQVAEALVAKGQNVIIEGYTDSKGSQSSNMTLSQRRADAVRTYLISRGFPQDKILARGMGPDRPIADNTSTEGRANNRRVEIVIAKNVPRIN
jgi:outer membrane protein OmpA-like peptidoglycan-associated protein